MLLLNSLKIEEKADTINPNSSVFTFHHLPSEMGVTIGNFLRRFLLSYVEGVAPVGVKITDKNGPAKSKLTKLDGLNLTTLFLILNLKKIILEEKEIKKGLFCLELKIENNDKGARIISASDFQKSSEVEIKNPELYLATLEEGKSLEIKMYCRKNLGYHQVEEQKEEDFPEDDIIVLDTDFSPIKGGQVNFKVETKIVGLQDKEEVLQLIINTNGSIKPKEALKEALEISQDYFANISKLIGGKKEKEITKNK